MKDVGFCWKLSPGDPLIGEFGEPSMEEREPRDPCPSSLSCCFFILFGHGKNNPKSIKCIFCSGLFHLQCLHGAWCRLHLKEKNFSKYERASGELCTLSKK